MAIEASLAQHKPETGGALLGPVSSNFITHFLFDDLADTGPASFRPSLELGRLVQLWESHLPISFKGIIHSHPGLLTTPSSADLSAFANALRTNPHLGLLCSPIVTLVPKPTLDAHEVANIASDGQVTFYTARLRRDGSLGLSRAPARIVPAIGDTCSAVAAFAPDHYVEHSVTTDNPLGIPALTATIVSNGDPFIALTFTELYPYQPPLAWLPGAQTASILDACWSNRSQDREAEIAALCSRQTRIRRRKR